MNKTCLDIRQFGTKLMWGEILLNLASCRANDEFIRLR